MPLHLYPSIMCPKFFEPQMEEVLRRIPQVFSQNAPAAATAVAAGCPRLRLSLTTSITLPQKPPKLSTAVATLPILPPPAPTPASAASSFHEKLLFLESLGVDLFAASAAHSALAAVPLAGLRAVVDFLRSLGFSSAADLRRILGMCPEILAADPEDLASAVAFLLREAGVQGRNLRHVIARRPRLLVSDVAGRLRPTLYFLQMLGVVGVARHAPLLSCGVEEKFLPRLEFLEEVGFSQRDARRMARRFPQLFCYSIEGNLRPKIEYLRSEMGRELAELREFPQYFSFSMSKRIRPRHLACMEKGVCFPLPALLRPSDEQFNAQLEVCDSSTPPMRSSPLWREGLKVES